MHLGLALPQYDYSVAGERPLRFETIVDYARASRRGRASTRCGCRITCSSTSAKYGGPPDREACYEPVVTLAALARRVPDVRLGTLVFCEALRPASVLAKALATLDRVCGGRLDVGLGAGLVRAGVRRDRHGDAGARACGSSAWPRRSRS